MVYKPDVRVTIGTQDVTAFLDGPVTVKRGRDTVYSATNAGFASFELLDQSTLNLRVGRRVRITAADSTGARRALFTGTVSDFERQTLVASQSDPFILTRIQAVGPLAGVNRRFVFEDGRPVERDGARVSAAIAGGLAEVWEEQPLELNWEDLGEEQIWETYGGFNPALFDPGIFDVVTVPARPAGYNPLQIAQETAQSAEGILFETPAGEVGYADANRRFLNARDGYLNIPLNVTVQNRLDVSSELADITNDVTVVYGDEDLVRERDLFSIVRFGTLSRTLETVLADLNEAELRASEFLARHAAPTLRLQEVGINLRAPEPALLDALFGLVSCGCTDAIELTGVPAQLGFVSFRGFVEGVEWVVTPDDGELRLFVSDAILSLTAVRYGQLEPDLEYGQVDPTLEYGDARVVEAV